MKYKYKEELLRKQSEKRGKKHLRFCMTSLPKNVFGLYCPLLSVFPVIGMLSSIRLYLSGVMHLQMKFPISN